MMYLLLRRLRVATLESEKEEILHEVRQLRKMGQAGDLPRDLVRLFPEMLPNLDIRMTWTELRGERKWDATSKREFDANKKTPVLQADNLNISIH